MRIVFSHDKEHEAHAKTLIKHHIKEYEKKFPRISGASYVKVPMKCECGNTYWVTADSYRYSCYECDPPRKRDKESPGFS